MGYHEISLINETDLAYHKKISGINQAEYHEIPTLVTKDPYIRI